MTESATPKTVLVDVTPEDIALGIRVSADRCPIARAIKRATGVTFVSVYERYVSIEDHHLTCPLPPRIRKKIARYDSGATMRPTQFELVLA